ncbi:MAG: DUF4861 domain-containing protein [Bacteroidales bacterium]|jgi:hypothetical protein|nr:DUF4861 domain-containing protein [Bacteroidales bacterium]
MKTQWLCFVLLAATVSCRPAQIKVNVSNPFDLTHDNITVEIAWKDILAQLPSAQPSQIMVINLKTNEEQTSQVIFAGTPSPQALLFQVTLAAKETAGFLIREGTPKPYPAKTFGRHVPERKDDFAWENDRTAFRMYGPALAREKPSNGVDLWLKKTEKLIIDRFYHNDLKNKKSYHVDHGEGLDCYKVGHELGAGGIAPYINDTLWVGNHYVTQEVLDNGPLRTTFRLTYNNLPAGQKTFSEDILISLDAGSQLNKAIVSFDGDFTAIRVAAGISLHNKGGVTRIRQEEEYIGYGETATSDAGLPAGRNFVGVILPGMTGTATYANQLLALAPYSKGEKLTYYFGGGWNQWGFADDDAWFDYLARFAACLKQPLTVTLESSSNAQ